MQVDNGLSEGDPEFLDAMAEATDDQSDNDLPGQFLFRADGPNIVPEPEAKDGHRTEQDDHPFAQHFLRLGIEKADYDLDTDEGQRQSQPPETRDHFVIGMVQIFARAAERAAPCGPQNQWDQEKHDSHPHDSRKEKGPENHSRRRPCRTPRAPRIPDRIVGIRFMRLKAISVLRAERLNQERR